MPKTLQAVRGAVLWYYCISLGDPNVLVERLTFYTRRVEQPIFPTRYARTAFNDLQTMWKRRRF